MGTLRAGPLAGVLGLLGVLVVLASTVGLGLPGWSAGVGFGVLLFAALSREMSASDIRQLSPGDRVTLLRTTLVGGATAVVADGLWRPASLPVLVLVCTVALLLDAVDGRVARRTATTSDLGARFDMEVDAFLILVLSVQASRTFGLWVLAIGGMRYANGVVERLLPWLRQPLPPRYWRKVVAAVQGVVLLVATAGVVAPEVMMLALMVALGLLTASFGSCAWWLFQHRAPRAGQPGRAPIQRGPEQAERLDTPNPVPKSVPLEGAHL